MPSDMEFSIPFTIGVIWNLVYRLQMYSIIETAKANDVNLYHYLTLLLERLPHLDGTDESFEEICPWNESVKEEVEKRIQNSMK